MAHEVARQDCSMYRRCGGRGVPARPDAQGVRRAEAGRLGPDPGSPAAAGRRHRPYHCPGFLRRPASRGLMVTNTGTAISVPVGKATLGRIMDVLGNPIDERGPDRPGTDGLAIHRKAPAYDELSPSQRAAGNRHQGDRPGLPVRQGRQGRVCSVAPVWARP